MRKLLLAVACMAALAFASAESAQAQQPTDRATALAGVLAPARVVRLHFANGRTAAGTVLRVTDSTVAVGACTRCSYRTYRIADVAAVDTMVGHPVHAPRVVAGAFAGGLIAGGAYVAVASRGASGCHDGPCGLWVLGVPPAVAIGALVGSVVGVLHPYVHWDAVTLEPGTARSGEM